MPFIWLTYLAFNSDLGANPAETMNKKIGEITLYLFLANLYWGSFEALINNRVLKPWYPLRRPLGVATFVCAVLHFLSFFAREGDINHALEEMGEKTYLLFGLASLFVLFLLAITSNNWSVRKLKHKNWKNLHRLVFVAFFLISAHVFLIEKRSPLTNKYTLFPMMAVLLLRILQSLRLRFLSRIRENKKV